MELYLRLVRRAYPHRWRILQSLACMMLVSVLNAVSIGSLQPVFDGLFGGAKGGISLPPAIANLLGDLPARIAAYVEGRQMEVLTIVALFVLVVYILKALLTFIDVYQMRWVSSRLQTDLSNDVYGHIHNLSLSYFTRTPTGEIMQRTVVDVSMVGGSVTDLFRNALREPFNILSLVGLLFVINWKLALLSFTIFPIAIYPIVFFGRKIRKRSGKVLEVMTELLTLTQESIAGARIVKAFGMEKYEQERYRTQNERVFRAVMRISLMDCLTHPFMETLGGIGVVAGIWVGGYFVLSGEITGGGFVAFLGALGSLYNPIKRISQINNNIQQGIAALKRIYQLLETKPEVVEAPDAVVLPQIAKRLEFSQVSFAYESNQPILRKVTFAARPGELVAIVGHSGAGKTTLVNLIPRFYDVTGGSIAIDGHDLRTVTLKSLRTQMGIVTQETILFDDTVFNNIAYGRKDVPAEQVYAAAHLANAAEFIESFPEGYMSRVGERGVRLSGGQKQRIAIARAILKDPPILILDEATSSLDAESERLVQDALDRVMENRLTLVIAHRLSTVIRADQILVLEEGMIVEQGTHAELMAQGGAYARLYSIQFEAAAAGRQNGTS